MTNRIDDIQPLIQDYRSKINGHESEFINRILDDYEELLHLFKQKNDMISHIWDTYENEKYYIAQNTLDPLEQILFSSLLGIRTLDQEAQSDSAKEYLATLRKEIERQLDQLKKTSISIYPICMQDLGPYGAIKSFYELLKEGGKIKIDVEFQGFLKRQPHKVEIHLFRFVQHLILMIDTLNTVPTLIVSINEKDAQIVLTLEGEALVEQLGHSSEYHFFKELVDSIKDVEMLEEDECRINLVLQTNNQTS
ncbi:hypothetical protein [Lysinibacillus antri]|uniref:Uncharacterized protein n=1 Tax=Lysinibacillus antri TaxID=2498145 RepID=A0A3S0P723_9BACI|nr:hypothetical protein [Lysinibacillus antri]RUL54680.1 hypothetical protein EK386_05815 [Lysinibacillus antri]